MPRSKQDNLYFKDYEKLVFGTEEANQAIMYHDGSSIVFDNITISGAQGPAGPPGAGVPGDVITNENGSAGIEVNDTEYIDIFTANTSRMLIDTNSVAVGRDNTFSHNWGDLIVKTETEMDFKTNGLKLAFFGNDGYQTMDFLRSTASSLNASPTTPGRYLGAINWSTTTADGMDINPYTRILAKERATDLATESHTVDLKFQSKLTPSDVWVDHLSTVAGADGFIKLNTGVMVNAIVEDYTQLEDAELNDKTTLITAWGVVQEVSNFRAELYELMSTISGAQPYEIFDSTISGSRIDCASDEGFEPSIDFTINGTKMGHFDSDGFTLGTEIAGQTPPKIIGIINQNDLDESLFNELGETIATTSAIKEYIDIKAGAGEGSGRLMASNGDELQLTDDVLRTDFASNVEFELWHTGDGPKFYFGGVKREDNQMLLAPDLGDDIKHYHTLLDTPEEYFGVTWDMESAAACFDYGQWQQRVQISQKHTATFADWMGTSLQIMGWNWNADDPITPEGGRKRGPGLVFTKIGGNPKYPTHVKGNDLLGMISFDYTAKDDNYLTDRGAWIEARKGTVYRHGSNLWQEPGGITPAREDWSTLENELILGASTYLHLGRIRLRSKLYFDDGSDNFVSGIMQSENTPLTGDAGVYVPDGQDVEDNPWHTTTLKRHVWGLDHVIPTVQWVKDEIANYMSDIEADRSGMSSSSDGYNFTDANQAFVGQNGFIVRTGYDPGSLVFSVSGHPKADPSSAGRFTWAARLQARDGSSRFFLENYSTRNATTGGKTLTGELNFFRSFGGDGMTEVQRFGSNVTGAIPANNNGAVIKGTTLGMIQAYGQAQGNGIDRDPCTWWVQYEPGAKIVFKAGRVTDSKVWADVEIPHCWRSYFGNMAVFDYTGVTHLGYRPKQFVNFPGTGYPARYGHKESGRKKGWVNINGGRMGQQYPAALNLWSDEPCLAFSSTPGFLNPNQINDNYIDARIGWLTDEGLVFKLYNKSNTNEEGFMCVSDERSLVIGGTTFENTKDDGILVINQEADGLSKGITLKNASNTNAIRIYHASDTRAVMNAGSNGNKDLVINTNQGAVKIGLDGYVDPASDEGKLIVHGNIIPTTDNEWNLGLSSNRWNDVWATNGTIQVSDRRDKKEIADEELGLKFINSLRPVSFKRTGGVRRHHGIVAQELENVFNKMGKDSEYFAGLIHDKKTDKYGVRYEELIAPMMKAIQELSEEVKELKKQLEV
jgi:hypothetical protein